LIHNDVVARHVNQFIARDEQLKSYQTSPPYLDVTNSGVVQTVCHPEGDPDDPRGVLCIDVAPTISAPERTDPLLDIALVRTDGDGKIINEQGDVQLPGRVVSELENLVRHPKADIGYFTVEGELFAVILVRGSLKSNVFAIARIKRRAGHAILTTSLLFMMVLSMGLVVTLVLVSLRRRSLESEEGMLRNLQVGVIQVSGDDLILEANDRAEELVGYTLPPLGGGEKAVSFSSLFHERTFKEDPRGRLRESSLREIREERLQGHSSRYFVKKREDGLGRPRCKWMHVYGSPWLLAGKSDARTFAVLSPASSHREGALEEAGNEAGVDA
jgi:PAS domain-containing protein